MTRPGLWNKFVHDATNRGPTAWAIAALLFAFYIVLYYTDWLGPNKWTIYGAIYSIAITAGGIHVIRKYRHNPYQVIRTTVVIAVQCILAFSVPLVLRAMHQPEYYFSYLWPLRLDYLTPGYIFRLPLPYILYSFLGSLLLVPILGALFGKRWYCSWVCGCGGLANTFGEPWRHLTSKSSASWRFEKVAVHSVLGICLALTALLFISWNLRGKSPALETYTYQFQTFYGIVVGIWLSGIIGVGLYPLGGTRVWCRNFCPMAALLGLVQKVGRYRITVKPNMCISCGMCSKYCEMGIDVRSYAQSNESFTRASCVGCGLCAEVCPRGVLKLENVRIRAPQEQLVQIAGTRS